MAPEAAGVAGTLPVDAQRRTCERRLLAADTHGAARRAQLLVARADVGTGEAVVEHRLGVGRQRARDPRRRRARELELHRDLRLGVTSARPRHRVERGVLRRYPRSSR